MITSVSTVLNRMIIIMMVLSLTNSCTDGTFKHEPPRITEYSSTTSDNIHGIFDKVFLDLGSDKDFDFCTFFKRNRSSLEERMKDYLHKDFYFTVTMKQTDSLYYHFESETNKCELIDSEHIPKHIYYKLEGTHLCMPKEYWDKFYSKRERLKNKIYKLHSKGRTSFFVEVSYN